MSGIFSMFRCLKSIQSELLFVKIWMFPPIIVWIAELMNAQILYWAECTIYSQINNSYLTVLPQALFHSRQMEGNITTACTIAFIRLHTRAVLTVSYSLRMRELSRKAVIWFRHLPWKRKHCQVDICWSSACNFKHL